MLRMLQANIGKCKFIGERKYSMFKNWNCCIQTKGGTITQISNWVTLTKTFWPPRFAEIICIYESQTHIQICYNI